MNHASTLTNQIINFLYEQNIFAWRASSTGIFDKRKGFYRTAPKKGVADIIAIVPPYGRIMAIEVKIGKDHLSDEQRGFMKNVVYCGGISIIAKDFDKFEETFYKSMQIDRK